MSTTTNYTPTAATESSAGCACCSTTAGTSTERSASVEMLPSTTDRYQVVGITCGRCTGAVTAAVAAVEGVVDVQIDLNAGGASAMRVVTERPVAAERVRAVEEAGYALAES